jgi:hypothetical protein
MSTRRKNHLYWPDLEFVKLFFELLADQIWVLIRSIWGSFCTAGGKPFLKNHPLLTCQESIQSHHHS